MSADVQKGEKKDRYARTRRTREEGGKASCVFCVLTRPIPISIFLSNACHATLTQDRNRKHKVYGWYIEHLTTASITDVVAPRALDLKILGSDPDHQELEFYSTAEPKV